MVKKLVWLLFRKPYLQHKYAGFSAHYDAYVDSKCSLSRWNVLGKGTRLYNSTLGQCTYVAGSVIANCDIGAFCSIGPQCLIGGLGKHPTNLISTHPAFYSSKRIAGVSFVSEDHFEQLPRTAIGNDVWIGARAIVLDGVTIGNGAIVAAGSIVVKNVPPYALVGGVPARVIKNRFSPEQTRRLQELKWWDWPIQEIERAAPLFRNSITVFLDEVQHLPRHSGGDTGQPSYNVD